MAKYFFPLLFLSLFTSLSLQADEYAYFYPKLHQNLWPDFCLEHLEFFSREDSKMNQENIARLSLYADRIPRTINNCDFRFCLRCQSLVVRGEFIDEDMCTEEEEYVCGVICYKCRCLKNWYHPNNLDADEEDERDEEIVDEYWENCSHKAVPHKYFTIASNLSFFEQYLKYCQENPTCLCYWPYRSKRACEISDAIYHKVHPLIEHAFLSKSTSSEFLGYTTHDILTILFTHSFFYSQYRQILLQLTQWEEFKNHPKNIDQILDELQPDFLHLYSKCLEEHPHPKIFYERGMVLFHRGKTLDSLRDIRTLITWAKHHQEELLTSELYLQEGIAYAEVGLYDQAIVSLNHSIHKDPHNKQAYFERAAAYFELGQFDVSLEDYLASKIRPESDLLEPLDLISFSLGLVQGILKGGLQAGVEYIPSLLSSMQGLGHGLWAFARDPVQVSTAFAEAAQACVQFVKDHTSTEVVTHLVPELKELIETWDTLEKPKRGELTGQIIGKYGVDIFAGVGLVKGMKVYRELKKANTLLTLEALATSEKNKILIALEAAKRAQTRKKILQHAKINIQWDKQGKHIQTHKNFQKNKSILEHPDPQKLARDFCGKGIKIGNRQAGTPGYREIVDFKEFIGYAVDFDTKKKFATNWGKIHYAKDGIHIVPTKPRF
ncbi:MAG: hypothetical protein LBC45_05425 [Chlamydiales bacterium]|jgi:tetratricopeptide (TPR) repeat protein|nr:hypothetical protein [Chlamydiales bacterium]